MGQCVNRHFEIIIKNNFGFVIYLLLANCLISKMLQLNPKICIDFVILYIGTHIEKIYKFEKKIEPSV